jgi:hypothetical protein
MHEVPSEPTVPQLSTPGQLDVDGILKRYEARIGALTTQNVMMETQLEAAMTDRQSLINYIEYLQSENAAPAQVSHLAVVPDPVEGE